MNHYHTKHIPVSRVSLRKLVPGISSCQRINTLVHTKDILRVSACQNVSIMTYGINFRRSVTPGAMTFDRINSYIFPVRTLNVFRSNKARTCGSISSGASRRSPPLVTPLTPYLRLRLPVEGVHVELFRLRQGRRTVQKTTPASPFSRIGPLDTRLPIWFAT